MRLASSYSHRPYTKRKRVYRYALTVKKSTMIVQTIHEILNPFDVNTPIGEGTALFIIAGSIHSNPQFIVRLHGTGDVRTIDQNHIRIYGNPMDGRGWDIKPNSL